MAVKLIKKKDVKFEFKKGREYYYLYMGDIVYLISEGRKIKLVTLKGTYEYYGRLEDALNNLNKNFVLIHQSYVINKEHVLRYAYKDVEMADGTILSISPAKRKYVRRNILGE
ncbi:MAG: LytTR family transcriptional regulator [Lachnospiraceae bacterium]|nr:LytTR family transcriptional regulator [Lachnospiraceae bacterium]